MMTEQERATVLEVLTDTVLATLPPAIPLAERLLMTNLIRRDAARRLQMETSGLETVTPLPTDSHAA